MPLLEDVPGDYGLAGHDAVMRQQDTPSVDELVAVRIMTGSVRLGAWGVTRKPPKGVKARLPIAQRPRAGLPFQSNGLA